MAVAVVVIFGFDGRGWVSEVLSGGESMRRENKVG